MSENEHKRRLEAEIMELKKRIVFMTRDEYNNPAARATAEAFGIDYDALLAEEEQDDE